MLIIWWFYSNKKELSYFIVKIKNIRYAVGAIGGTRGWVQGGFLNHPPPYFWKELLTWILLSQLDCPASLIILLCSLPAPGLQVCIPSFYKGPDNLYAGPRVCAASPLQLSHPLSLNVHFFIHPNTPFTTPYTLPWAVSLSLSNASHDAL